MARMMPSWVALALLVALLAAAMQHSLAEEEQGAPSEATTPTAPEAAAADAPEATPAADVPVTPSATEAATDGDDGAPAPSPAASQEEAKEEEGSPKSIGAKAKAGFHNMMEGLSAGKAKLECKILGNCPPAAAAAPDAPAAA